MNLRRIRHGKRLTQEELAHRSGLSTRHIGAIERADMSATLTVVGQIAEVLRVETCRACDEMKAVLVGS